MRHRGVFRGVRYVVILESDVPELSSCTRWWMGIDMAPSRKKVREDVFVGGDVLY